MSGRPRPILRPKTVEAFDPNKLTVYVTSEETFERWTQKGFKIGPYECQHRRDYMYVGQCRCWERHFLTKVIRKKNKYPNIKIISRKRLKNWILAEYDLDGFKDGLKCIEKLMEAKCYTTPKKK